MTFWYYTLLGFFIFLLNSFWTIAVFCDYLDDVKEGKDKGKSKFFCVVCFILNLAADALIWGIYMTVVS